MKKQLLGTLAAASLTAGLTVPAQAEVTATAGMVSDYVFRGDQLGGATGYASVDYEQSGFYAGIWTIMDRSVDEKVTGNADTGLEIDYYLGYGMELDSGFNFSLGYSLYTYEYNANYLEDFEDEFGGSVGYGGFGASFFYGWQHGLEAQTVPYTYYDISWSGDVFGVVLGHRSELKGNEYSYTYAEISASGEVATMDMTLSIGKKFDQNMDGDTADAKEFQAGLSKAKDTGTGYIVLDVSKTFSL